MRSVGTPAVTIVTIITLIFSVLIGQNKKPHLEFVGAEVEQQVVQCTPSAPCPPFRMILRTEIRP